jgi:GGDEF domain-containing protein
MGGCLETKFHEKRDKQHAPMARYEIFQQLPSKSPARVETAPGLDEAVSRLNDLARRFPASYFIRDLERSIFIVPFDSPAAKTESLDSLAGSWREKLPRWLFDHVDPASVEKREFHLAIFSLSMMGILLCSIAVLMYPLISRPGIPAARESNVLFFGFCTLSILLLAYLVDRQSLIRRLRREILQKEMRYVEWRSQLGRDLLATLPGMNIFQERLAAEFGSAVRLRDTLSVMLIRLTPNLEIANPAETTAALGDAVKAISHRLRREDSLYRFAETAFGTIQPGVNAQDAQVVAKRLAESLQDAAGAPDRFTHDIKILNYPQHAATAAEVEFAIRSVLPDSLPMTPSTPQT